MSFTVRPGLGAHVCVCARVLTNQTRGNASWLILNSTSPGSIVNLLAMTKENKDIDVQDGEFWRRRSDMNLPWIIAVHQGH